MQDETDTLLATAETLADAARAVIMPWFRKPGLGHDNKAGPGAFDPVTQADRSAEIAMREILGRNRPQDAILGEELGASAGQSGLTWALDPIDGTRAFLAGAPTWGVLIALSDASGPLMGIIDQPFIGERFVGVRSTATTPSRAWTMGPTGHHLLTTRGPRPLSEAILLSTFPEIGTMAEVTAFHDLAARVQLVRYGLDCYAYALLAAGQIDLVVEAGLQPYDIQAPIAVIEAAGGIVTDWRGGPAWQGGRVLAAANPEIHAEALAVLSLAKG
jgi:myo-inositol-1(or 4)-monophosphatase